MGKQDVHRALIAMDDDAVRARLADGDFTAVDGLDLTDEEQELVRGAASDFPEVAGFSLTSFLNPGPGAGDQFLKLDTSFLKLDSASPSWSLAIKYLKID